MSPRTRPLLVLLFGLIVVASACERTPANASATPAAAAPAISPSTAAPAIPPSASPYSPPPAFVPATPAPTDRLATHEDAALGYRISLAGAYRRLAPTFVYDDRSTVVGLDTFTLLTEQEERAECLEDTGDLPSPSAAKLLYVWVYRNPTGMSAAQWSTNSLGGGQPLSTHRRVQPLGVSTHDAVKLVADNATAEVEVVVIRADDRMYVISPTMWTSPSPHRLEDVAATFATIARQPLPTPTASPAPDVARAGASQVAASLASAFMARDADAVARLLPDCRLSVSPVIDGREGLPNSGGGGIGRSVPQFVQALRDRFAAGDLTVTVDPTIQVDAWGSFFVRSLWKDADRTTQIDLVLGLRDGRWLWLSARHQYRASDLGSPPCVPYRSPWVSGASRC